MFKDASNLYLCTRKNSVLQQSLHETQQTKHQPAVHLLYHSCYMFHHAVCTHSLDLHKTICKVAEKFNTTKQFQIINCQEEHLKIFDDSDCLWFIQQSFILLNKCDHNITEQKNKQN